jgi:hypothetical protein
VHCRQKCPNDPRNGRVAERLDQLATETKDLSEEASDELQNFYSWASGKWSDAVLRASRQLMASLSAASLAEVASKPKFDKNTFALKKINYAWKGNSVSAAYLAFQNPTLLPWRTTINNNILPLEIVDGHRSKLKSYRDRHIGLGRELLKIV